VVNMDLIRLFRHLLIPAWLPLRRFPTRLRDEIEVQVAASERCHRGELCVAIEAALPWRALLRGQSVRQRAAELFAHWRVWDTEENSGVLIYLQLIDRRVEILADRGIAARVPEREWQEVCRGLEEAMRRGECRPGVLAAFDAVTKKLERHFPARTDNPNELPNRPRVL